MPKPARRTERMRLATPRAGGDPDTQYELPLKLLVLGDFTQREQARSIRDQAPTRVDRNNFDQVMRQADLRLSLRVPNRLTDEPGSQLGIELVFESLDDFGPDKIAAQVPQLQRLLSTRTQLLELLSAVRDRPQLDRLLRRVMHNDGLREQLKREVERDKGDDTL